MSETKMPMLDWVQVVLNGRPPCFHVEPGAREFCGRADTWAGHDVIHEYIPLERYMAAAEDQRTRKAEELDRITALLARREVLDDLDVCFDPAYQKVNRLITIMRKLSEKGVLKEQEQAGGLW